MGLVLTTCANKCQVVVLWGVPTVVWLHVFDEYQVSALSADQLEDFHDLNVEAAGGVILSSVTSTRPVREGVRDLDVDHFVLQYDGELGKGSVGDHDRLGRVTPRVICPQCFLGHVGKEGGTVTGGSACLVPYFAMSAVGVRKIHGGSLSGIFRDRCVNYFLLVLDVNKSTFDLFLEHETLVLVVLGSLDVCDRCLVVYQKLLIDAIRQVDIRLQVLEDLEKLYVS